MTSDPWGPWGVDTGYLDAAGTWQTVSEQTATLLRQAMGAGPHRTAPPPGPDVKVIRHGTTAESAALQAQPGELTLEDGTRLRVTQSLPPDLPIGYHRYSPLDGTPSTWLVVSPGRCHLPADLRGWVLAAQLYASRSRRSWGIGDLTDLATLTTWAGEQGAALVAVNPLHAPVPTRAVQASPYTPSSRRWLNPLYLDIGALPGAADDAEVAELGVTARTLNERREIDHDEVWRLKRTALKRLWAARSTAAPGAAPILVPVAGRSGQGELDRLERWRAQQGDELESYARFCALAEHFGSGWPTWPDRYRHPDNPAVARFAADNADRVRFWAWVQLLAHDQLTTLPSGQAGVLHDLAVGVGPDGADAWMHQDLLALDIEIGAPPDNFNTDGQCWGLPPFIPWKLREAGYQPLAEQWRAVMQRGQGIRIDHVMGLFRLYWVPAGRSARDGGYVRYRGDELLAVLAVESHRAGALVVGEDLGTVEDDVRAALTDAGVLSTRVAWFSEPPEQLPGQALSGVTTHDLPTVAGAWSGDDAAELRALGRDVDAERSAELRGLLEELTACGDHAAEDRSASEVVAEVILRLHARLAQSPSMLAAAALDDLLAVRERPNVPGTVTERPNWSLSLPEPLDDALRRALPIQVAAAMRAAGR